MGYAIWALEIIGLLIIAYLVFVKHILARTLWTILSTYLPYPGTNDCVINREFYKKALIMPVGTPTGLK